MRQPKAVRTLFCSKSISGCIAKRLFWVLSLLLWSRPSARDCKASSAWTPARLAQLIREARKRVESHVDRL